MHDDELEIDDELVRTLIAEQFPDWAGLPLVRAGDGTVNVVYRLGTELSVRLPRRAPREDVEDRVLAAVSALPLDVPRVVALGKPTDAYPWEWAVHTWLDGVHPDGDLPVEDVAALVAALHRLDPTGAPEPGYGRRRPLAERDDAVRDALTRIDAPGAVDLWDESLRAPGWHRSGVWVHADLDRRNVVERGGRLAGVLDWAGAGVGDPALDVMVAWKLVARDDRERFRALLDVDDATWLRAKGWCVSQALIALGYYTPANNPAIHAEATRWLAEVLHG
jgi:aminoglycoside phosphotransferase (APT) family kinase protein